LPRITWVSFLRITRVNFTGIYTDIVTLQNGHWVLAYNDTEDGRFSLAVSLSTDEGKSWPWTRHLERDTTMALSAAYPSIIQARNRMLHVVYSYSRNDLQGQPSETIKYGRFTEAWIRGKD